MHVPDVTHPTFYKTTSLQRYRGASCAPPFISSEPPVRTEPLPDPPHGVTGSPAPAPDRVGPSQPHLNFVDGNGYIVLRGLEEARDSEVGWNKVRTQGRVSVQAILHRSGCHIALQGTAEPDGEETWCLLKVWEDLAPLLGDDMRMHTAVVAMYILLGDMYGTMFEEGALQAPEVAQAFQRWVCPEQRSPYINWMLHDATVTIQPYGPMA